MLALLRGLRGRLFFVGTGAFLLGIICGTLYSLSISSTILLVFLSMLSGIAAVLFVQGSNARLLFLALGISGILFSCGLLRANFEPKALPAAFQPLLNQPISLLGTIVADPDIRAKNQQLVVEVQKSPQEFSVENESGSSVPRAEQVAQATQYTNLLVFAPLFQHFAYGEKILIAGTLTAPTPFATDNGRTFRYDTYLAQKQIFATVPEASILEVQAPQGFIIHAVDILFDIKHDFVFGLSQALPDSLAQLASGILTGDQHQIPENILSALEICGMLWIVVLSGYHITLIASSIEALTAFLPRKIQYLFVVMGVTAIVFATGASAPSLRGALMAALSLYARATHRTYDALRALCFVAICLLLWNPFLLAYDFGFQLSIIVTPAILLGVPILEARMLWIKLGFVREVLAVSIVAQLACLPLVLWETGQLELWAIPANILTMWLVPFTMVSSFVAGIAGMFLPPLAPLAALPSYYALSYLSYIAKSAASLPYAALSVPVFSFVYVIVLYAVLIWLFAWLRTQRQVVEANRKQSSRPPTQKNPTRQPPTHTAPPYTTSLKKRFSMTSQLRFSKNAST